MERVFSQVAADGHAMTLAELRNFLASIDGMAATERPTVRISFGGGIKRITIKEEDG